GRGMRLTRYYAEMVPKFWVGSLIRNSRIFQEMTVADILRQLMSEMDVTNENKLTGTYEPRNYCSQYRESNLAFLSRLMEEEGIFYFHIHKPGSHTLTLSDASLQAHTCGGPAARLNVSQNASAPQYPEIASAYNLEHEQAVVTGKVLLWDHHAQLPGKHLEADQAIKVGDSGLEVFDYPGGYSHRFDGINSGGGEQASALQKVFNENARVAD